MLSIRQITINGLFGAGEEISYSLSNGINALLGENGSGKSTVLESLRFALTGKIAPEGIHAGLTKGSVEIEMTDGNVLKRKAYLTDAGGVSVRQYLNGRDVSKTAAAKELFGDNVDNAMLILSGELEKNPDGPAGTVLMSYMDTTLTKEEAMNLILSDEMPDDVRAAIQKEFGNIYKEIGMSAAGSLSEEYAEKRRAAKRAAKALASGLPKDLPEVPTEERVAELAAALESAQVKEAQTASAGRAVKEWEQRNALRTKSLAEIEGLKKQIAEKERGLVKPARSTDEISAKINENAQLLAQAKADYTASDAEVKRLTEQVKRLTEGTCPLLSTADRPVRCMADLAGAIKSVKESGRAAVARKQEINRRGSELSVESGELKKEFEKAREYETKMRDMDSMRLRMQALNDALLPEEKRPETADPVAAKAATQAARMAYESAVKASGYVAARKQLDELALEETVSDILAKGFAPDGPVCVALISGYTDALTAAAESSMAASGMKMKFEAVEDGGLSVLFAPEEKGSLRPYGKLSGGEKMLACLMVTDILCRISGCDVLLTDNMERMDDDMLAKAAGLLSGVKDNYGTILLAAAEHPGTADVLNGAGINIIRPEIPTDDTEDETEEALEEPVFDPGKADLPEEPEMELSKEMPEPEPAQDADAWDLFEGKDLWAEGTEDDADVVDFFGTPDEKDYSDGADIVHEKESNWPDDGSYEDLFGTTGGSKNGWNTIDEGVDDGDDWDVFDAPESLDK